MKQVSKTYFQHNTDNAIEQGRALLFICAIMQAATIFFVANKPGFINKVDLIISVITALVFIILAFVVSRNSYKIILTGIILYSVLLVFNAIINYTTIFQGIITKVLIYAGLISALYKIKSSEYKKNS